MRPIGSSVIAMACRPFPPAAEACCSRSTCSARCAGSCLPACGRSWTAAEDGLRLRWPGAFAASLRFKARLRGRDARDVARFLDALKKADLLVLNGSGIFTDAFKQKALAILATLDLALRRGTPAVLFAQGLGPLARARSRASRPRGAAARHADRCPRVARRVCRCSPPSAWIPRSSSSPGTTRSSWRFLRRRAALRPPSTGGRSASTSASPPYAEVDAGRAVRVEASARGCRPRASCSRWSRSRSLTSAGMDVETLRALLAGVDDGGASLDTPRQVIERIAECRVMVTGSYHGAVFALAQGIPVVALARSPYYVAKMDRPRAPVRASAARSCDWTATSCPRVSSRRSIAPGRTPIGSGRRCSRGRPIRSRAAAPPANACVTRLAPFLASRLSAERAARPRATSGSRRSTRRSPTNAVSGARRPLA